MSHVCPCFPPINCPSSPLPPKWRNSSLESQPEILRTATTKLRTGYDYTSHGSHRRTSDSPNARMGAPELADWVGLAGPPAYLIDRLGALVDLGLRHFNSTLSGPERERLAAEVMPAIKGMVPGPQ